MVRSSISMVGTAGRVRRAQRRARGPPDTRQGTRAGASAGFADPGRGVAVRAYPSSAAAGRRLTGSAAHEGVKFRSGAHGAYVTDAPGSDQVLPERPAEHAGAPAGAAGAGLVGGAGHVSARAASSSGGAARARAERGRTGSVL